MGLVSRLRRTLRRLAAPAALACALAACNTPTVPLPPPQPGEFTIAITSTGGPITIAGKANSARPSARYEIYNEATNSGVIVLGAPDGSFTSPPFPASLGDRVDLSYELNYQLGDSVDVSNILCVVVRPGQLTESDRCQ